MKICIVTTAFPRWENDGRVAFLLEEAQAIKHLGNKVRVIAMHNPGSKTREDMDGIDVIRPRYLPERWENLQKDSAGLPQAWQNNLWSRLQIVPFLVIHTLAVAYWSQGFDIIHANWTLSAACVWVTRWYHQCPYVTTVHGSDIFKATRLWLPKIITKRALTAADKVISVSRALYENVIKLGVPKDKVCVISNGVNLGKFTHDPSLKREQIILFVGSLIERKGIDILLTAFSLIKDNLPNYHLIIIGEGRLRTDLENLTQKLGIYFDVSFLGFQSQATVHQWMQKAKVFVLPSNEEGQGVVLLEALACGTPCVGANVGGITDVVSKEVGELFSPGDSEGLSKAILKILNSDDWEKMSISARERAENDYDWEIIAKKIVAIYQKVIMEVD
jgi:glycosyltransferase involved in cell wall biosynthesis